MATATIFFILALFLFLLGVIGLVSPALPGLPLLFAAAWAAAYAGDYQVIGVWILLVLLVIALIGMSLDFIAGLLGAKYSGAGKPALWGAFAGGVIGIFFGIAGMIAGPIAGAAAGELFDKKDLWRAGKVSVGTFFGLVLGTVAKVGCALAMVLIVAGAYIFQALSSVFAG